MVSSEFLSRCSFSERSSSCQWDIDAHFISTGKSLLWVAVLGLVVFYIYALISFALLRSSFDPDEGLYCATLWQCTVTVIRYGLTAEIFDVGILCSSLWLH